MGGEGLTATGCVDTLLSLSSKKATGTVESAGKNIDSAFPLGLRSKMAAMTGSLLSLLLGSKTFAAATRIGSGDAVALKAGPQGDKE